MSFSTAAADGDTDADWIITGNWNQAADLTVEGDWILAEDPSSSSPHPRLIGFFLQAGENRRSYIPLLHSSDISASGNARASELLVSLPPTATLCASYRGFLLAGAAWSRYYISAPFSNTWTHIPKPQKCHSHFTQIAVADGGGSAGFLVVFAVPSSEVPNGFYRFDIFVSSTGKWRIGGDVFPIGEIRPNSSISCGRWVYFRTATPSVVGFDSATGFRRLLPPPPRCWEAEVQWELAEASGWLRSIMVRNWRVEVHRLGEKNQWELLSVVDALSSPIDCRMPPRALRSEGEELGIVLWVDGRVVRWELQGRRAVDLGFVRAASPPECGTVYLPHCSAAELRR